MPGSSERRALEALAEREAYLQAILDTVVEGIVVIDERGVIESANRAAERIFGYRESELVGQSVAILMPPGLAEQHAGYLDRYLASGEARIIGLGREVEARRRDGSRFPAELAVSEVRLPARRVFVGLVRDISDRRRSEERMRLRLNELAHASRLLELGEMTSGIAHEINQPLTAIVSFAEAGLRMLEPGAGEPALVREALGQIIAQGQRAAEIIQRLRQFTRKGAIERRPLDLNQTLRDVLALLGHELRRGEVQVGLELAEPLPPVAADRIQIEQVLVNLVRNASEAVAARPLGERRVGLATAARGETVEVAVSDSGKGLPEGAAGRLFQPFFTTKADGLGVGLAISRSIIESHGGRLWAEPAGGGGACFRFTLPLAAEDAGGG